MTNAFLIISMALVFGVICSTMVE